MNKRERGASGEEIALKYLKKRGYKPLCANYRAARCEIDLIMRDGEFTVFIEVKSRIPSAFGTGREAVNRAKQQNIIKAALCYMQQNSLMEAHVRFDVAEVDLTTGGVTHIINAFSANA